MTGAAMRRGAPPHRAARRRGAVLVQSLDASAGRCRRRWKNALMCERKPVEYWPFGWSTVAPVHRDEPRPVETLTGGLMPATGSVAAPNTKATGLTPDFVGKPNPRTMRTALNRIDANWETAAMIGDRMDTDVISGLECGLRTVLVLTRSTRRKVVETFPYRPTRIADTIGDVVPLVDALARPVPVAS
jgi:hypothetical protein